MTRGSNSPDMVVVSANGVGVAWSPGLGFTGLGVFPRRAAAAALHNYEVLVHPSLPLVVADDVTPLGAFAALQWAAGGRAVVVSAPVSVLAFLDSVVDEGVEAPPVGQVEFGPEGVV